MHPCEIRENTIYKLISPTAIHNGHLPLGLGDRVKMSLHTWLEKEKATSQVTAFVGAVRTFCPLLWELQFPSTEL